ncbi:MaoC family dehydratase [Nocardia panacis]|uniref:MaoC family dehydratase n=1 Tax=Nocardia panacis TaxID=2340916 RepID=A0A3A4KHD3_9NOCA|nr:MaoC family dehydratase [Nocardia panacis]RJO73678.1 MaoC family dehydratase [Nocardia panacis]
MTTTDETKLLSAKDFPAPITDRYFEDYLPGESYRYGYRTVSEAEIIDFATQFDPQPIHIDPDYAARGPFGGIIGSGWHSAGILMRLFADHYLSRVASLASPGVDELRWFTPLRPGARLELPATITEARLSRSKPDRGLVHTTAELRTSDSEVVIGFKAINILRTRESVS